MDNVQKKQQTDWIAAQNFIRFQALLDLKTDDRKCKILSQLLAEEFDKFEKPLSEACHAR